MPKEVNDIKEFLMIARGKGARSVKISKTKGVIKFKVRCRKYLYTLKTQDEDKATKLEQSLAPGLEKVYISKAARKA